MKNQLVSLLDKMSLERATKNTFQDSQLFRYHLKAIHQDGYAFDDEERIVGIRCVAVPVFRNQEVIAALAIAAPAKQISAEQYKTYCNKAKCWKQSNYARNRNSSQHIKIRRYSNESSSNRRKYSKRFI